MTKFLNHFRRILTVAELEQRTNPSDIWYDPLNQVLYYQEPPGIVEKNTVDVTIAGNILTLEESGKDIFIINGSPMFITLAPDLKSATLNLANAPVTVVSVAVGAELDVVHGAQTIANSISGGAGDDLLNGGDVSDAIIGGDGEDIIWGFIGADYCEGNSDADTIDGGPSSDLLILA